MNTISESTDIAEKSRKHRRGSLQVYESMREDILWLRIDPGSAIDEVALAERFKISRTPIREALLLLSGDDLVKFLPNRTTIVAPLLLDNTGAYLDTYLILSRAVVRSAALNSHFSDEADLQRRLALVQSTIKASNAKPALRADLELRRCLGALSGNEFQQKFFNNILDAGIRTRILHYYPNANQDDLQKVSDDWNALVASIRTGRVDDADEIMTAMIMAEGEIIVRALRPKYGQNMNITTPNFSSGV